MPFTRLDKILADAGLATRSEARRMISQGRATVDGAAVTAPNARFNSEASEIRLDGVPVCTRRLRYFMMNKPEGVVSATEDADQRTVLDLLPKELRYLGLFPVGRLDKDTTGLIILTNDGALCHEATSPKHHVDKVYEFTADGMLDETDVAAFAGGIVLQDGTVCRPAALAPDSANPAHGTVALSEGKYHQVKRMLASRGARVLTLRRIAVGGLALDPTLAPGAFRELSPEEVCLLHDEVTI